MTKKCDKIEKKLPIYVLNFPPNSNKRQILSIRTICYCAVKWENFKNKFNIIQCFKCQAYGHISQNCFKIEKCLKCAKFHYTSQCKISDKKLFKCANCEQIHLANDPSCPDYLKISNQVHENQHKPVVSSTPVLNIANFPKLHTSSAAVIASGNTQQRKNKSVNNDKSRFSQNNNTNVSFSSIFTELRNIFGMFNFTKQKNTIVNLLNLLKTTTDPITKLMYIIESITDFLDG